MHLVRECWLQEPSSVISDTAITAGVDYSGVRYLQKGPMFGLLKSQPFDISPQFYAKTFQFCLLQMQTSFDALSAILGRTDIAIHAK